MVDLDPIKDFIYDDEDYEYDYDYADYDDNAAGTQISRDPAWSTSLNPQF